MGLVITRRHYWGRSTAPFGLEPHPRLLKPWRQQEAFLLLGGEGTSCIMTRVECLRPMREIYHSLQGAQKATSASHPHLSRLWGLHSLSAALDCSMLIYGAIWCQVIAHQYPIYHPACHGLWLLFHKAKAFEKEPVTQNTEEECKKCNVSKFFLLIFFLLLGLSMNKGKDKPCVQGRELQQGF